MAEIWTPLKLITWTQGYFGRSGVDAPRLTAEVLLAHVLECERIRLYLDFDKPLGEAELARFRELVKRRAGGEPTAYLTGRKEFFSRSFKVDRRALIPRPETELLVEAALSLLPQDGLALDLCTGSGVIGITLALERPGVRVLATDLSAEALALASENVQALGARLELLEGDLFAPVPPELRFQVIVANPPYVPTSQIVKLAREIGREPVRALDGGGEGLAIVSRIIAEAPVHLAPGGALIVELHESHREPVPSLCRQSGFEPAEVRPDLAGLPRFVVARLPHV